MVTKTYNSEMKFIYLFVCLAKAILKIQIYISQHWLWTPKNTLNQFLFQFTLNIFTIFSLFISFGKLWNSLSPFAVSLFFLIIRKSSLILVGYRWKSPLYKNMSVRYSDNIPFFSRNTKVRAVKNSLLHCWSFWSFKHTLLNRSYLHPDIIRIVPEKLNW